MPTILINNAAIVNGKSILDLTHDEIERYEPIFGANTDVTDMFIRCFKINLLSHFTTVKEFLPGMLEEGRGTIVTISSVLGYLGSANLCK